MRLIQSVLSFVPRPWERAQSQPVVGNAFFGGESTRDQPSHPQADVIAFVLCTQTP